MGVGFKPDYQKSGDIEHIGCLDCFTAYLVVMHEALG